jgi:hypothetical protein
MNIDPNDQTKISQLLRLSEDQLLSLLPAYAPEYENTVFSPPGQLEAGREVFGKLKAALHQRVCVEWKYCEKGNSDKLQDPVVLVASVADVVATSLTGIPPFVISALLLKIGLRTFCQCQ